jgi:PIN domain nuclease of toxin-antitoxin system
MSAVLADTQAIVWYLFKPTRLTPAADHALTQAERSGGILVSAVSVVEVIYLVEKARLLPVVLTDLLSVLKDPARPIDALPLSLPVAEAVGLIPRAVVPDLPDRIIGATALAHGLSLVTSDAKLHAAPVVTIW